MTVRERLRLTPERAALLVRVLQLVMIAILVAGVWYGRPGVVVNGGIALLVTQLPALFERRYAFTMNEMLVLWITLSMFLHAFGTLPLPGLDFLTPYKAVWWWDHVTHTFSSSLVAAVGYATARALDVHTDAVTFPPTFMFAYLLLFMMAFGVVWELLEFYVGVVSQLLGIPGILTQYGLEDTILDLAYDTVGALLVATIGTAYLTDVSDQLAERLSSRTP
ncbi:hypothetical protein [Natrinema caseinilyticum]|uniref:hypothetical protein n=1 Tax=Natrinema caseinilyticum TaxID=2961570 RepID=UPI0020C4BDC9|nr:hypothetical protein [Natrinema caseinilyticum]